MHAYAVCLERNIARDSLICRIVALDKISASHCMRLVLNFAGTYAIKLSIQAFNALSRVARCYMFVQLINVLYFLTRVSTSFAF